MHFYNILTVGQFSRKLSHIIISIIIMYYRKLHLPCFWFILFLRVRACELIVKMESLAHSAELGLELDDSGKRSYSLLRDMLPPLETLVVTVQGFDGSDGVSSVLIPNRLLEEWANARSTETNFVALVNERIEGDAIAFDPEALRLQAQLYNRSLATCSKLQKARGRKREELLLGSTKIVIQRGEVMSANQLQMERDEANVLLAEADSVIEELLVQMQDMREELAGAHELFTSQNSQHGSKIDDVSSRHARRKICEVEESAREALEFLPSYGLIAESLKVHTSAGKSISIALSPDAEGVNTPDSCSNLRVLYLLDKFGVSDSFYHELCMIFSDLPRSHGIKKARIELNRSMTLHRIDGFEGAYRPFEEILCELISRMVSPFYLHVYFYS